MLLYHTLRQLSTEDADCYRFALPHRRPSGLIFLRHRFTDPPFPGGLSFPSGDGGKKESKRQGRQATRKASPPRHLLSLPRGRGPSQTPKFLSPGPPSPWLPALPPRKQTETFGRAGAARVLPRGCKGRSPLHEITLNLPLPRRGRGWGDRGQKGKQKAGSAGDQKDKPPCEYHSGKVKRQRRGKPRRVRETPHPSAARLLYGRVCKCRKRSNAGVPGAKPPAK